MAAGPYPTKEMFEQLKQQVAGVGGNTATAAPQATYFLMRNGDSRSAEVTERYTLRLTWQRRTLNLAGISLEKTILLEYLEVRSPGGFNGEPMRFMPSNLKITASLGGQTTYMLQNPMPSTSGYLEIGIAPGSLLFDGAPLLLPQGMDLQVTNDNLEPTALGPSAIGLYEGPPVGIPIVPTPSGVQPENPDFTGIPVSDRSRPYRTEIVWPATGTAYLHVVKFSDADDLGTEFHVPLTPGLPQ